MRYCCIGVLMMLRSGIGDDARVLLLEFQNLFGLYYGIHITFQCNPILCYAITQEHYISPLMRLPE